MKIEGRTSWRIAGAVLLLAVGIGGVVTVWNKRHPGLAGPVSIAAQPSTIWLESNGQTQSLSVDFLLENQGRTAVGIDKIDVQVFDRDGKLLLQRFIDSNGFAPSIETISQRVLQPGSRLLVFNPFHSFPAELDLHKLSYRFSLSIPGETPETSATISIEPQTYRSKSLLTLPVRGRLLVHDGHDFYAHHRRLNTEHPIAQRFGLIRNFMRYAVDLNHTDEDFRPFKGAGTTNEEWHAWGQEVLAPAAGAVADAGDGEPDNVLGQPSLFNPEVLLSTPMKFYGNYIVIDHGNGEFSLLGHLQKSSVKVKVGDRVSAGDAIARVGSSGSSNNPHLHFELRDGKNLLAEGLPAVFRSFRRQLGRKAVDVDAGPVDTGDLLLSP